MRNEFALHARIVRLKREEERGYADNAHFQKKHVGRKEEVRLAHEYAKRRKYCRKQRFHEVERRGILDVINIALQIPSSAYIKPEHDKPLPNGANALYELLRLLLKIRSQEQGVVAKLIASDDDLKHLAVSANNENPILKGWRLEIFGTDALALRKGELSISYNPTKRNIELLKRNPPA